jgi:hypothetical protein
MELAIMGQVLEDRKITPDEERYMEYHELPKTATKKKSEVKEKPMPEKKPKNEGPVEFEDLSLFERFLVKSWEAYHLQKIRDRFNKDSKENKK